MQLRSTFFFMDDMRLRMRSISGSGPLGAVAQIFWLGHPSQALALPASAEAVPGQCSGASAGALLMERAASSVAVVPLSADARRRECDADGLLAHRCCTQQQSGVTKIGMSMCMYMEAVQVDV